MASAMTFAPTSAQSAVCNEAGVGLGGDYAVTGTNVDPDPPARFTADRRPIGNEASRGLETAAERSPALSQCGEPGPTGVGGNS
jgi:hypothetical protein